MSMPALSVILLAVLTAFSAVLFTIPPYAISSFELSRSERKAIVSQATALTPPSSATTQGSGTTATAPAAGTPPANPPPKLTDGGVFTFAPETADPNKGIDISHHNIQKPSGKFPVKWPEVVQSGVGFVYIKASQGLTLRDSEFDANWAGAKAAKMPRGAYHFLSALTDPARQAKFFLSVYEDRSSSDLPPALDVEWDLPQNTDHPKDDRWTQKTPDQIVSAIDTWGRAVATATGQTPVIYTNRAWWKERVGPAGAALARTYTVWLSDYGSAPSGTVVAPPPIDGFNTALWQFTDKGTVAGVDGPVDVNIRVAPTR